MNKKQIHKRVLELATEECRRQGVRLHSTEGSKIKQRVRNDFLNSREFRDAERSKEEDKRLIGNYIKGCYFAAELKRRGIDEYSKEGRELKRSIYSKELSDEFIKSYINDYE